MKKVSSFLAAVVTIAASVSFTACGDDREGQKYEIAKINDQACKTVTRILQKEGNGIYYGLGRESAKCEELHLGAPVNRENFYPNAMACLDNNLRLRVVVDITDASIKVSIPPRTYASDFELMKMPNPCPHAKY